MRASWVGIDWEYANSSVDGRTVREDIGCQTGGAVGAQLGSGDRLVV
jgi:hypothetical protein